MILKLRNLISSKIVLPSFTSVRQVKVVPPSGWYGKILN